MSYNEWNYPNLIVENAYSHTGERTRHLAPQIADPLIDDSFMYRVCDWVQNIEKNHSR